MLSRFLKRLAGRPAPTTGGKGSPLSPANAKAIVKMVNNLDKKQRLAVMKGAQMVEPLALPDTTARFAVHSKRELNRVALVKETWTAEWVTLVPTGTVLWDVGANIGVFTVLAALTENVQQVVAIEPSSVNAASLSENVHLNKVSGKVVVVHGGVGAETRISRLKLSNVGAGEALHSFGDMLDLPGRGTIPEVASEHCFLWRMDDLAALPGMPFPTRLKIDVDGYEREVLAGGEKVLRDPRLQAIQIEVFQPGDDRQLEVDVTAMLTQAGFVLAARAGHGEHSPTTDLQFVRASN
jgi:FkbM family methyltransferase